MDSLPRVYARVEVQHTDGTAETQSAPMWERLPPGWGRATPDQRLAWVEAHFRRALRLQPQSQIKGVICHG